MLGTEGVRLGTLQCKHVTTAEISVTGHMRVVSSAQCHVQFPDLAVLSQERGACQHELPIQAGLEAAAAAGRRGLAAAQCWWLKGRGDSYGREVFVPAAHKQVTRCHTRTGPSMSWLHGAGLVQVWWWCRVGQICCGRCCAVVLGVLG